MRDPEVLAALISPLISAGDGGTSPLPVLWRTGWRALTFGLVTLGALWLFFELGFWAGTVEERNFWAPLEAEPRRWPRAFRFLLRWRTWLADRRRARKERQVAGERRALLEHSGGRHRRRLPEAGAAPPVVAPVPEDSAGG